jgi:hypothetical protein
MELNMESGGVRKKERETQKEKKTKNPFLISTPSG